MRPIHPSKWSFMARDDQSDMFSEDSQSDLFGADPVPSYRPDPEKVRARLHKILAEARAAREWLTAGAAGAPGEYI